MARARGGGEVSGAARTRAWTVLAAVAWLVFATIGVAKGVTGKTVDFAVFHTAGARFIEGAELYRDADGTMPYKYPPFIAPLLVPFAALPRPIAGAAWNLASLLVLAWAVRFGLNAIRGEREAAPDARPFAWSSEAALWAGAILVHPMFFELSRGQADLFVLGAATAAVMFADRRPFLAGAFAVLAGALKLPALLLGLYFLRIRNGRVIASMVAVVALLEAVVFARYGWSGGIALHQTWRHVLGESTPERVMTTQSWATLVLGATGLDPALGMFGVQAVATAVLVGVLLWRRARAETWFAVLLVASAGLSPLCWNPNYVLAWPALILAFHRARRAPAPRRASVVALGLGAAALLFVLTPGIVNEETYQHLLGLLRPYAWLSLLLVAGVIATGADDAPQKQTAPAR